MNHSNAYRTRKWLSVHFIIYHLRSDIEIVYIFCWLTLASHTNYKQIRRKYSTTAYSCSSMQSRKRLAGRLRSQICSHILSTDTRAHTQYTYPNKCVVVICFHVTYVSRCLIYICIWLRYAAQTTSCWLSLAAISGVWGLSWNKIYFFSFEFVRNGVIP